MNTCGRYFLFLCGFLLCIAGKPVLALELRYVAGSAQQFAHPHDIVLSADRRYLYVADNGNDRIAVLDADSLQLVATFGESELSEPHDVVFRANDELLVADTGNSRIAIYRLDGLTATLSGELRGAISRPEGVAVHANGHVYATGARSGNIQVFADGQPTASTGGLSSPHDVSVAVDGSVWIADADNDRLVQMSESLLIKRVIEGAPYHFDGPRYLDFDDAGRLYVADKYNHQIKVLAANGALLYTLGNGRAGSAHGEFDRPEGITIRGRDIWIADTYNDRIVRYRIEE